MGQYCGGGGGGSVRGAALGPSIGGQHRGGGAVIADSIRRTH